MKTSMKKIMIYLICLFCFLSFCPVRAEGEEEEDIRFLTSTYYVITTGQERHLNVPYSDRWFMADATEYNHRLTQLSLGLATAAFRPHKTNTEKEADENLISFLSSAGFNDLRSDDYDKHPSMYTVSTVIGHKTIGEGDDAFELIAVGVCGQGYMDEWESNFSIGTGVTPDGFSRSAQLVYDRIFGYLALEHISGPVKIWMSGFSRAAAITNITSAWLSDSDFFGQENVFAYTFGTPRTTRAEDWNTYKNIFNICGKMDPVTMVPFAEWGYERYGTTYFTPCQETDSDFMAKRVSANRVYHDITGINYWSNPMINTQLRNILNYLLEICPNVDIYAASLQDNLIELWEDHSVPKVISKFVEMSEDPLLINEENRHEANMLLNYFSYMLLDYATQDYAFRRYNDRASLASNVAQAHTPEQYVSWVYSADTLEEVFSDKTNYVQMVLEGDDIDVSLYREGKLLESVSTRDKENRTLLYTTQSKNKITILIPRDYEYSVKAVAGSKQSFVSCVAQFTVGHHSPYDMTVQEITTDEAGSFTVEFPVDDEPRVIFEDIEESTMYADYDMLDTTGSGIVAFERSGMMDLSWKHIVTIVSAIPVIIVGFLLFLVVTLIAWMRHARMRRKGYIPKTMKFRPLPIFCTLLIFQNYLIEEILVLLGMDSPSDLMRFKAIIGVISLIIAFYGYRRKKDLFHGLLMVAVVLLTAADVVITSRMMVGAILHILAYVFLCVIFIREERPDIRQIISFVFMAGIGIFFILRVPGSYGLLRILAVVYIVASCLMVVSAFPLSRRYFRGAVLLFISGILLINNQINGQTFLSHFLSLGMYYLAVVTLASSGSGIARPKMVPITMLEEMRQNQENG